MVATAKNIQVRYVITLIISSIISKVGGKINYKVDEGSKMFMWGNWFNNSGSEMMRVSLHQEDWSQYCEVLGRSQWDRRAHFAIYRLSMFS